MRTPSDSVPQDLSLDEQVRHAFTSWNDCHQALAPMRIDYDKALLAHLEGGTEDPVELRVKLRNAQADCDRLFFKLLRVAEDRTRERYI